MKDIDNGMNKYLSLFLFAIFLFGSGFIYQSFYRPQEVGGVRPSGRLVEIEMRILENQWKWDPEMILVHPGDRVRLNIYNEDSYDHGFAIDVFGVNRRLFPKRTTVIEFTASLKGKFNFYCSVPCGDGHYDQIGTILVEDEGDVIASEQHNPRLMAQGIRTHSTYSGFVLSKVEGRICPSE